MERKIDAAQKAAKQETPLALKVTGRMVMGETGRCDDCGRPVGESEFMTVVDPSGKHDWDSLLVCDSCMGSERWDTWRATHYPEWPLPQLNEMVGG